jgi:GT2 family glycosyltransferase/SAM-dependent methyltransferase
MVPWGDNLQVVYEHVHRYWLAAELADGARVLDLACGEGYGAAMLAARAVSVVGVDIDPASIEHARHRYPLPNFEAVVGSIVDPELLAGEETSFDLITCFEAIEHVDDHDAVMANVKRLLKDDGVLLISTPDTDEYGTVGEPNPFHVHEMTRQEFATLLEKSFTNVALFGQRAVVGSLLVNQQPAMSGAEVVSLRREPTGEWTMSGDFTPEYLIALASDGPVPGTWGTSILADDGFELVRRADGQREAATTRAEEAESAAAAVDERLRGLQEEHAALQAHVGVLSTSIAELQERADLLHELQSSLALKALTRYRAAIARALPEGSRRRNVYGGLIRGVRKASHTEAAEPPLSVPSAADPLVSVVVPIHGQWEHTRRCLRSLQQSVVRFPFEVVAVDDASPDDTRVRLEAVSGLRLVPIDKNVGYLRATNAGIGAARGRLVLLLNNDTELAPDALACLVERMMSDQSIGVVGAKLVYPDGVLQEAGSIIWADGYGWNYGRGGDPDALDVNYPREVDYCSAAALLVRREILDAAGGGFDERFAPAYYEDTDLCFTARQLGYRVFYEPTATVVHDEGASHGRDIESGIKRHQDANRRLFTEKWCAELARQSANDPALVPLARQRGEKGRVVVVDHMMLTHDKDGGSLRMFRLLRILRDLGYKVSFAPISAELLQPYTSDVLSLGVEVLPTPADLGHHLASTTAEVRAVLVSRWHTAWHVYELIRSTAPDAPLIFDTVDLHFRRSEFEARSVDDPNVSAEARDVRRRELEMVRLADITLVVSTDEKELLESLVPGAHVELLANVHDAEPTQTGFDERSGLLFVGNLKHPPNADAVMWFVDDVLPRVRQQLPDVRLHIVGSRMPPEVSGLDGPEVRVEGWLPDLRPQYEARRIAIAPIRYGAGMKGKVTDALAHGLPVVTTSVGVEGMPAEVQDLTWIANDADTMVERILTVYGDRTEWEQIHAAAPSVVDRHYGSKATEERLRAILHSVHGLHESS